jgi:hypothetical protein
MFTLAATWKPTLSFYVVRYPTFANFLATFPQDGILVAGLPNI